MASVVLAVAAAAAAVTDAARARFSTSRREGVEG
jgi:hypothetical protein